MFSWFERLVNPFPDTPPEQPPKGFVDFFWAATKGMRGLILLLALFTAMIGAFEALLFAMLGNIVDWLSTVPPDQLWSQEKRNLLILIGILVASPLLIGVQALLKYQALNGNFAMRLRWNFHRHLLSQSMSFYQDEFAGRVSAKDDANSISRARHRDDHHRYFSVRGDLFFNHDRRGGQF